jgi:hypothetical protein
MYDESTLKLPHTHRPHRRGVDQAATPDGNLIDYPRNPAPAERVARTCPTCGYSATYASEPLANYHHLRHSCDKAQRLACAALRTGSGPICDCQHPGRPHLHATRTAYVKDQCRCAECRAANSAASRNAYQNASSDVGRRSSTRHRPERTSRPCARPALASTRSPGSPASPPATSVNLSPTHEPAGDRSSASGLRRRNGCWPSR